MDRQLERNENDPRPFPGPSRGKSYQFNAEELRVLKDCNRESFFQRCLPFSAILGGGIYYGVKAGFLRGHSRFGATPKVVLAVVVGYFAGKFSYQGKCAEKLMLLPNSPIGEMLRQRRKGGGYQESIETGFGPGMSLTPFSGMNPSDTYNDSSPRNSLDLDTSRPELEGLDDSHRPSVDNPIYEEEMPPVQRSKTTYDELRKQNREEYQQRRIGAYRSRPDVPSSESDSPLLSTESERARAQNKYGDTWG